MARTWDSRHPHTEQAGRQSTGMLSTCLTGHKPQVTRLHVSLTTHTVPAHVSCKAQLFAAAKCRAHMHHDWQPLLEGCIVPYSGEQHLPRPATSSVVDHGTQAAASHL